MLFPILSNSKGILYKALNVQYD
eukprot:UN13051